MSICLWEITVSDKKTELFKVEVVGCCDKTRMETEREYQLRAMQNADKNLGTSKWGDYTKFTYTAELKKELPEHITLKDLK
jgi:hypothetical protein